MQTHLITGGAGFIGANFVPYFIENNPEYHLVNLDLLTYAGNLENVSEVENHSRYTFVQGDICDRNFVEELFQKYQFHDVIHVVYVLALFLGGNIFESMFLTPWLVGGRVGLHPVAVIFAILLGGALFGFSKI